MDFRAWVLTALRMDLLPHIETFARFQAGFFSSEDFIVFLRFSAVLMEFIDFHVFSLMFIGLRGFRGMDAYNA